MYILTDKEIVYDEYKNNFKKVEYNICMLFILYFMLLFKINRVFQKILPFILIIRNSSINLELSFSKNFLERLLFYLL